MQQRSSFDYDFACFRNSQMRTRVELLLRQNKLTKQDVKDILEVNGFAVAVYLVRGAKANKYGKRCK